MIQLSHHETRAAVRPHPISIGQRVSVRQLFRWLEEEIDRPVNPDAPTIGCRRSRPGDMGAA